MALTSSVYSWAPKQAERARNALSCLRKRGYRVERVTPLEVRIAEAYPDRWKKDHRRFNPAGVPGL